MHHVSAAHACQLVIVYVSNDVTNIHAAKCCMPGIWNVDNQCTFTCTAHGDSYEAGIQ